MAIKIKLVNESVGVSVVMPDKDLTPSEGEYRANLYKKRNPSARFIVFDDETEDVLYET